MSEDNTLTPRDMWEQPEPPERAVHGMCCYIRKIVAGFDSEPDTKDLWRGPCECCSGWKKEEDDYRSAKICYIRAEEALKYAMAALRREGWKSS